MKLSLGPVLFYWSREKLLNFYAEMAEQPLDVIYLGETVCSKRRAMSLDDWIGLARELRQSSKAEIVLSGLALIEASSELSSLKRLCQNGEFRVEASDMGAVQWLQHQPQGFVAGPALNLYNGHALAEMMACGMRRWVPPVECSAEHIGAAIKQLRGLNIAAPQLEVFAYGHLPLAYSARCFSARARNLAKDDCGFCCIEYPEGMALYSQEREPLFVLNGIQTLSAQVSNLLPDYPQMQALGVDILRLSPRAQGMSEVIAAFSQVCHGAEPPLAVDGCNGYWHGRPGMLAMSGREAL